MSQIHGDLKGSNVLVSYDGTARIMDFDESLIIPDVTLQWATTNKKRFSIHWAAPELLEVMGQKSFGLDVYSLGMTILVGRNSAEAFSGKVPY
ncbi:unnamed protein product [Rhizoctonia solani]|uniref:Protein kinase domain-containing protein n=1 Tax=Rhizoctonia solani TaxID=456999 RepID=A0A8H3BJE5_9AGAM|nr:unnamed protein product [Rhizoctonia solani]